MYHVCQLSRAPSPNASTWLRMGVSRSGMAVRGERLAKCLQMVVHPKRSLLRESSTLFAYGSDFIKMRRSRRMSNALDRIDWS